MVVLISQPNKWNAMYHVWVLQLSHSLICGLQMDIIFCSTSFLSEVDRVEGGGSKLSVESVKKS